MTDVVERLRKLSNYAEGTYMDCVEDAICEIERLRDALEQMISDAEYYRDETSSLLTGIASKALGEKDV